MDLRRLLVPGVVMLVFWTLAVAMWRWSGEIVALFFFGYIGAVAGGGLGLYAVLPRRLKPMGRRASLLLIGTFLFGFSGVYGLENMQIEGLFFGLLSGVVQAAVVHYLIAKLIGPLLFGRIWCGWACWTVMILDLLPYKSSSGRRHHRWELLRYGHFGLSLGLVLLLTFGFSYPQAAAGSLALYWFLLGNALYYLLGIGLAVGLGDNRAFCKYVCPVAVPLKLTARLAMLRVKGDPKRCNACYGCVRRCPMDIRIPEYTHTGQRVLSTECSLCQTCITVCPQQALQLSFGLDIGGRELLRRQPSGKAYNT